MSHVQAFVAPALVLLAALYLLRDQMFTKACGSGGCASCSSGKGRCPVQRLEAVRVSLDQDPPPPDRER
jgi:hypothetical protein